MPVRNHAVLHQSVHNPQPAIHHASNLPSFPQMRESINRATHAPTRHPSSTPPAVIVGTGLVPVRKRAVLHQSVHNRQPAIPRPTHPHITFPQTRESINPPSHHSPLEGESHSAKRMWWGEQPPSSAPTIRHSRLRGNPQPAISAPAPDSVIPAKAGTHNRAIHAPTRHPSSNAPPIIVEPAPGLIGGTGLVPVRYR